MLSVKTNPVGIDIPIQDAQKKLHQFLTAKWGITDQYECYGRVYRNEVKNGFVAEVYKGDKEYSEVYWNDNLTAISFFGISDSVESTVLNKADVHLIFFVDLNKLALKDRSKNLITHRADEEVRQNVYMALGKHSNRMTCTGYELGLQNVLREYPGSRRDDRLKAVDMHPLHCFRFNYQLIYDPNKIC